MVFLKDGTLSAVSYRTIATLLQEYKNYSKIIKQRVREKTIQQTTKGKGKKQKLLRQIMGQARNMTSHMTMTNLILVCRNT